MKTRKALAASLTLLAAAFAAKPILRTAMLALLLGCTAVHADPAPGAVVVDPQPGFSQGQQLFSSAQFGTNGRSCATCHLAGSFTVSPEQALDILSADPANPLFRPIDSNDGHSTNYSTLLSRTTFRVQIPLAPNVTVTPMDDDVRVGPDGITYVTIRRSTPSVLNAALQDQLMWDGREGDDLPHQAISAVRTHAQPTPTSLPTALQAAQIAAFQRSLFSRPELRDYARGGSRPELPAMQPNGSPLTPAQARGRLAFVDAPLPRGKCAECHSGPMLDRSNVYNLFQPPGGRFSNNEVSEVNSDHNPTHTYTFNLRPGENPLGLLRLTLTTPDPGRIALTGRPCELVLACVIHPGSTQSIFRISSLWGVGLRAPYFHDHSAADLHALLRHYQQFFHVTAQGTHDPQFEISDKEAADIIEYLRLL